MSTLEERVNNDQDIIDSRDLTARIEELEGEIAELEEERADPDTDEDRKDEIRGELEIMKADLEALKEFAAEAESSPDFWYGETLIRDSYFVEYAQQLAEDIDAIQKDAHWPMQFIDWEAAAEALKQDYRIADFNGEIYWIRA